MGTSCSTVAESFSDDGTRPSGTATACGPTVNQRREAIPLHPHATVWTPDVPPEATSYTRKTAPAERPISLNAILNATIRRELKRREVMRRPPLGPVRLLGSETAPLDHRRTCLSANPADHPGHGAVEDVDPIGSEGDVPSMPVQNPLITSVVVGPTPQLFTQAQEVGLSSDAAINGPPFEDAFGESW